MKVKIKGVRKQVKDLDRLDLRDEIEVERTRAEAFRALARRLRTEAMFLEAAAAGGERRALKLAQLGIPPQ